MPKMIYQGNPGYVFPFSPAPLSPGDEVDVPDEFVASVGDDFAAPKSSKPTKSKTGDEPTDPEGDKP